MNFKKRYIFLIILMFPPCVFAQDFKLYWKEFKAPNNWKIEFKTDSAHFMKKKILGEMVFKNEIDDHLIVAYQIFNDFEIDSLFKKQIERNMLLQSCLPNSTFNAFNYKGYYYLPMPCNACLTNRVGANTVNIKKENGTLMTNCEYLNNRILKFVALKP